MLTDRLLQGRTSVAEEMEWDGLLAKHSGIPIEDLPYRNSEMDGMPEENTEHFFGTYIQD